jgi:glutamate 5-kinase
MALYDDLFGQFGQPVAQILLTKNDLADVSVRIEKSFININMLDIAFTILECY